MSAVLAGSGFGVWKLQRFGDPDFQSEILQLLGKVFVSAHAVHHDLVVDRIEFHALPFKHPKSIRSQEFREAGPGFFAVHPIVERDDPIPDVSFKADLVIAVPDIRFDQLFEPSGWHVIAKESITAFFTKVILWAAISEFLAEFFILVGDWSNDVVGAAVFG